MLATRPRDLASADTMRMMRLFGRLRILPVILRWCRRRGIAFVLRLAGIVAAELRKWVALAEQSGELRERIAGDRPLVR
jgi:hypothetical protein